MKLLAIDTSMAACSAAVIDSAQGLVLAARHIPMERGHAEAIAPMVKAVMAEAGVGFSGLDRIAVTIGPGTFTGVRVGLAMARGLGLALAIPVIGIDSLSAIAANEGETAGTLLVVADARRDEVYTAQYSAGRVLTPPAVIAMAQLVVPPAARLAGSAAEAVMAASGRHDLTRGRAGDLPDAAKFGPLAGAAEPPQAMPSPLYLRQPDAKPQLQGKRNFQVFGIREAAAPEAPLLAALHAECFDHPWTADDFARLLAMPGAAAAIALDGGQPVGFMLTRKAAGEAEILTIGTRPLARRRGVAMALIGHAARREGTKKLFIEVAATNTPARALYARCGFSEAGTRRNYYQRGSISEDAVIMARDLSR